MTRLGVVLGLVLLATSAAGAAEIWKSTFDSSTDGVADIYDDNPSKVMIGTPSGGLLPMLTQDSTAYPQTDRAGRPLGFTVDGHAEYSALITFQYGGTLPTGTTYTELGFSGSGGSNPGISRQVVGALMVSFKSGNDYFVYPELQWGSSTGQDRDKASTSVNLGADPTGKTFQLAIGYQGDFNLNTNSPDPGTGNMYVAMYDAAGNLLSQTVQGDITNGDSGQNPLLTGLGGEPGSYPSFLSNQQITHLGALDYVAYRTGNNVTYLFDSMAWYDSRDGAKAAVVPEPASAMMLIVALGGLGFLRRR